MRALWLAAGDGTFWMPESASTYASDVDFLFYLIYWVSVFFFVLIGCLMFYFAIRYRQTDKSQAAEGTATHSTPLEIGWSVIPIILVLTFFTFGFVGYMNMSTPKANAYEVVVTGFKWGWSFRYPDGTTSDMLVVPNDRPIKLVLESTDVIHSFYVPQFRIKKDCVPGRYNKTWFEPVPDPETVTAWDGGTGKMLQANVYDLYCAEYCGTKHSKMLTKVVAITPEDFRAWLAAKADPTARSPLDVAQEVYRKCSQCHSVDGSANIGPTWKNLFGSERLLSDGSKVTADENYVRESILYPASKVAAGYDNVMPTYKGLLSDAEITAVIQYMKSLSDDYKNDVVTDWDKLLGTSDEKKGEAGEGGEAPAAE